MRLPPIHYHYFRTPLPYKGALQLQEQIHRIQLHQRRIGESFPDVLLLLQHRPVYTAGRRQLENEMKDESARLRDIGADFSLSARGGLLTYHGPGQITGYPMLDLSRSTPSLGIRDYICLVQKSLEGYLSDTHAISSYPSDHTGVFLDRSTKIASIGVQVRHRLTSHGFALNITNEPISWFNTIVACGLDDVKAGSIELATNSKHNVVREIPAIVQSFGSAMNREMVPLHLGGAGPVEAAISEMEEYAVTLPATWPSGPTQ